MHSHISTHVNIKWIHLNQAQQTEMFLTVILVILIMRQLPCVQGKASSCLLLKRSEKCATPKKNMTPLKNMGSIYLLLGWLWSASLIFLEEGHYPVQSLISLFRELEVISFVPDHDPDQKWRIWVVKCLWYHFPINLVDVLVIILATFYWTQERRIPLYHACTSGHCTKLRWNCNKQERLDPFIPCLPLHRATATDSFLPQLFCARDHAAAGAGAKTWNSLGTDFGVLLDPSDQPRRLKPPPAFV